MSRIEIGLAIEQQAAGFGFCQLIERSPYYLLITEFLNHALRVVLDNYYKRKVSEEGLLLIINGIVDCAGRYFDNNRHQTRLA